MTASGTQYTVRIERRPDGGVQAWIHRTPGDDGMSSTTVALKYFLPREASQWTDEEALDAARAWGQAWLDNHKTPTDKCNPEPCNG